MNNDFLEKLIVKGMLESKEFLVLVSQAFEKEYFDDATVGEVFEVARNYIKEYKKVPPKDLIKNSVKNKKDVVDLFNDIEKTDYNISEHYDALLQDTNAYLKEQSIKNAIISSVGILESNGNKSEIRNKIEDALCKDLKIDLGLRYFEDLETRLKRIYNTTNIRIPTFYPMIDEFISGGFPPLTLSIFISRVHGGKSNTIANFAARQVFHGYNIGLMTLEMSEDAFAQRFDSILSLMDINRMYISKSNKIELYKKLKQLKGLPDRGEIYIKDFPTGNASVKNIRIYIRELLMRGIPLHILYVDYINLMKTEMKSGTDLYSSIKKVSEELRALSFEFRIPVVSLSQLNREGTFATFEELDFRHVAESMGTVATADFITIYGQNENEILYENEIHGKIVKNRLGGRVGDFFKLFSDSRSLKYYDESELELWIADAQKTRDERKTKKKGR